MGLQGVHAFGWDLKTQPIVDIPIGPRSFFYAFCSSYLPLSHLSTSFGDIGLRILSALVWKGRHFLCAQLLWWWPYLLNFC